jgi:hypothetical protein
MLARSLFGVEDMGVLLIVGPAILGSPGVAGWLLGSRAARAESKSLGTIPLMALTTMLAGGVVMTVILITAVLVEVPVPSPRR